VIAAGGTLRIDRSTDQTNYQARVASAIRFGKVPEGKLLVMEMDGSWKNLVIRLQDPPDWMNADLRPIPIPQQLRSPHKVVRELAADHQRLRLTKIVRPRGLRLLQGLVAEAQDRGYPVQPVVDTQSSYQRRGQRGGLFTIAVKGHSFPLALTQEHDRVPHEPTADERRRAQRDSWYRIPSHDQVPSDRLAIEVIGAREYRKSRWVDGARRLEDQLC
jgi:hypothetical protein